MRGIISARLQIRSVICKMIVGANDNRCHPERSANGTKSKDLRTDVHYAVSKLRRFFDSLRSLRMTQGFVRP